MSETESQKENSQKSVLTQIQNRAIIVSSQGEVKSHLQPSVTEPQSQDRVSSQIHDSQASSCVASQGQVLTLAQLASQNNVSSQSTVASQGQAQTQARTASQHSVPSQASVATQARSVSSQPIKPTLSEIPSQKSVSSSQGAVSPQKRKRSDIIADMPSLAAVIEAGQQTSSSEESQDAQQNNNE